MSSRDSIDTHDKARPRMSAQSLEAMPRRANAGIDPRQVQDRRDLNDYLSQSLSSQYRVFADEDITQTATYIKSYIVEVDRPEDESHDRWRVAFPTILTRKDANLLLGFDIEGLPYFIDTSDPRFCIVHSIARTADTDRTMDRLVSSTDSGFDHAWMPTQFLLGTRRGQLRGFKFSHQFVVDGIQPFMAPSLAESVIKDDSTEGDTSVIPSLRGVKSRLTISDSHTALDDYRTIQESGVFVGRQALDWIQFIVAPNAEQSITNGVYTNGKIIGNGTSIELHLLATDSVRRVYASAIRRIESDFAIGWKLAGTAHTLTGEPLLFTFPSEIKSGQLDAFVGSIFRSSRPFRLFGIPHSMTDSRIDIEAIDLHSGDPFSVEVTRNWMRLYLPLGSCGNVVSRLYANLQHAISSDITLVSGTGELLFSEQDAA